MFCSACSTGNRHFNTMEDTVPVYLEESLLCLTCFCSVTDCLRHSVFYLKKDQKLGCLKYYCFTFESKNICFSKTVEIEIQFPNIFLIFRKEKSWNIFKHLLQSVHAKKTQRLLLYFSLKGKVLKNKLKSMFRVSEECFVCIIIAASGDPQKYYIQDYTHFSVHLRSKNLELSNFHISYFIVL